MEAILGFSENEWKCELGQKGMVFILWASL